MPRKFSDKIWNEFKAACNHYFDRLHASKNKAYESENFNFEKKVKILDDLKSFKIGSDKEKDLETVKGFINQWKAVGRVPFNKKNINGKFNKVLEAIFKKLGVSCQESELLKYGNKIQQLAKADDEIAIQHERTFIRRKIDEAKNDIRQLENNLQFFSDASEDSPLVKEVVQNIERQKKALSTWKFKLKNLNIMEHSLKKGEALPEDSESIDSEEE